MELTREETIKALRCCIEEGCNDCPLVSKASAGCVAELKKTALHYLTKNEPTPAGAGTSSVVKTLHLDDNTKAVICQEAENIHYRLVQAYDEDLESNLGLRLYGEALGLLEAWIHSLKGEDTKCQ